MARTLLDLADSLEKKGKAVETAASEHAKKVAETIVSDLVYATPVDTSQALSNWEINLAAPVSNFRPPHFPGERGSTRGASASEAIAEAKRALVGKKPGQPIYIVNSAPYIRKLNEGSSAQEPAGFVERAVLLGRKLRAKFTLRG